MAQLMSVLAEFERDLLRARVRSGMAAAKAHGVTFGRQAGFAPTQRRKGALILSKRNEGKSIRTIADELDISTATVQRVLKCGKASFTGTPPDANCSAGALVRRVPYNAVIRQPDEAEICPHGPLPEPVGKVSDNSVVTFSYDESIDATVSSCYKVVTPHPCRHKLRAWQLRRRGNHRHEANHYWGKPCSLLIWRHLCAPLRCLF